MQAIPYWLHGRARAGGEALDVIYPFTGDVAFRVALAGPREIEEAIAGAVRAAPELRRMPAHRRAAALRHVSRRLGERADELALVLVREVGKPLRDAGAEVGRAVETFALAAEEATRINGEYLPLDGSPRAEGRRGVTMRVPVGPCAFITPFNFPLNLAAHKVGPAIACGCPFILKPAERTPVSSLILGEILAETDLPEGTFSVLPCSIEHAAPLVEDARLAMLSFTGSSAVGWGLRARAGRKRVALELGGTACCLIDQDADLERAATRLAFGAYAVSGQSCISVQRIMAHRLRYAELRDRLVGLVNGLRAGDPMLQDTDVGPMIREREAQRVEQWIGGAVARGAKVLAGGARTGAVLRPTLIENAPVDSPLMCEEVFGPVATIEPFDDFAKACETVNLGRFGLQAGVFTNSLRHARHAFDELEVGAVIVNDVPTFRADAMPYGGVKESGAGREGVRWAIREMTEERLLVV